MPTRASVDLDLEICRSPPMVPPQNQSMFPRRILGIGDKFLLFFCHKELITLVRHFRIQGVVNFSGNFWVGIYLLQDSISRTNSMPMPLLKREKTTQTNHYELPFHPRVRLPPILLVFIFSPKNFWAPFLRQVHRKRVTRLKTGSLLKKPLLGLKFGERKPSILLPQQFQFYDLSPRANDNLTYCLVFFRRGQGFSWDSQDPLFWGSFRKFRETADLLPLHAKGVSDLLEKKQGASTRKCGHILDGFWCVSSFGNALNNANPFLSKQVSALMFSYLWKLPVITALPPLKSNSNVSLSNGQFIYLCESKRFHEFLRDTYLR